MPQADRIADILAGRPPAGARVTVQGWIRTRRDSKAGLSFLHVHDGSCFDALQVVAPAALPKYQDEILRLTAGCAVTATGTLAPSQGKGQAVELLAESVSVVGWVDDPESYPISPKRHTFEYLREVAHLRPRTNTFGAVARVRHCLAMAMHRYFDEHGFLLGAHADHHRQRCRRRRRDVPRLHARPGQPPAHDRWRNRLLAGFLRQAGVPHGFRTAQRRDLLPGALARLHVRADVPRRELQHQPPPRRVLDGRAGDRLRRSRGQRRLGGGLAQVHLSCAAGRARRRHGVLRASGSTRKPSPGSRTLSRPVSSGWSTPRRSTSCSGPAARSSSRWSGGSTCRPSTSGISAEVYVEAARRRHQLSRRRSRRSTCA